MIKIKNVWPLMVLGIWLTAGDARADKSRKAVIKDSAKKAVPMGKIDKSCTYRGKRLWGKVKVVTSFPDFKVQVVGSFPHLKVKRVTSFPDKCGKWKFVKSFPDFKVQFVKSFPDFKIKYVTSFPGVP